MTIPTLRSLARQARRLDQHLHRVESVLAAMRHGNALHLHFSRNGPVWMLTDGTLVHDTAAKAAIEHAHVASVGDGLFSSGPSQTYRYIAT